MHSGIEYLVASATSALAASVDPNTDGRAESVPSYGSDAAADTETYRLWLNTHSPRRAAQQRATTEALEARGGGPLVSVVVPVYRAEVRTLARAVESLQNQTYTRWEAVFVLDGPADTAVSDVLRSAAAADDRLRIAALDTNQGIAAATNHGAEQSTGEFVAFLDQDDELERGILADVALATRVRDDVDVLYSDQDKIDEGGERSEPYFKPDWSPDLLLSNMYLGHLLVVRAELFRELGGFRSAYDGSQDYDLALRATERARHIHHLAVVGYHWRTGVGSTATEYDAKPVSDHAARRALADAMSRRGEEAEVEPGLWEGTFRVRRKIVGSPLVRVIIPFHDGADMLQRCLDSLHTTAGYANWDVVLVDNRSWQPETQALVQRLRSDDKLRLTSYAAPFNWAAINNIAARDYPADFYLFMNSDIEGKSVGWMAAMIEHAQRPEVGAVGARLLYPEGLVQHAGIVMGLGGGVAWHAFCFCPAEQPGYFAHAKLIRNYTGVTGACMMVRHDVFEAVGGFDEELAVAYNDVDFCLRLREADYLIVYTPFAELLHYEGATRGKAAFEHEETAMMMKRWGHVVRADPYFNPNLNPLRSECQLAVDQQETDLWAHLG